MPNLASKAVLLDRLQHALAQHMQAVCTEDEVDLRRALLAYEIAAQLAGLGSLPTQTLDVLRSKVNDPQEIRSELRALYIGIQRISTGNATLEWADEQLRLCNQLKSSLRFSKINHCFNYLFTPKNWHLQQRRTLCEKSALILPLMLFSTSSDVEITLRRALMIDRTIPLCKAYNRIVGGQLNQSINHQPSPVPAA